MQGPRRILLIRLSHLGDIVHALPVYHALRAGHPEAQLAWVTQPEFADLVQGLPGLERTILFARRDGAEAWLRLREDVASFAPDLVVDAQGNMKSAFCALSAGAARRVGMHAGDWREALGAVTATERAPRAAGAHAMDRMLALARHVAPGDVVTPLRTDPGLTLAERERGRVLLERHLPAARPGAVIAQLARPADVRSWPVARFVELLRELERSGRPTLVLSGPGEASVGDEVRRAVPESTTTHHWVDQRGLRDLAALFTAAADVEAHFVGCDSGPLHLAAACGLAVTCLSGPQPHERTGPWPVPGSNSPHRVLTAALAPPCAPCADRTCSYEDGPVCMSRIEPQQVLSGLPVDVSTPRDMLAAPGR
jgi:heptosyltransferase-1